MNDSREANANYGNESDVVDAEVVRYFRRVIRVKATDSPNVRLGLAQERAGLPATNEYLVPGVLSYREYRKRRATWDKVRQCIGLDGEFWKGKETLLYPPEWLNLAEERARRLNPNRKAKAGGCDSAEGGDDTSFCALDEYGIIEVESLKTPNTNDVPAMAIVFMRRWDIPAERFAFDRGGGGKQHADRLRAMGHNVMTVGFGEAIATEPRRGLETIARRKDVREVRYEYKNRRAQMYGELSEWLDPSLEEDGPRCAIPERFVELRRQMAPIPKLLDGEGRYYMLPKSKGTGKKDQERDTPTLTDLIGRSPDDLDAVVLGYHALRYRGTRATAGAVR